MSTLRFPEQGENMEHFGKKIRVLRKVRRWSQEDLAREIGVSLSTVQRWETKGGKPIRLARRELQKFIREAGVDDRL
jgi:transcriptional regulator with XRE-family HTH domain